MADRVLSFRLQFDSNGQVVLKTDREELEKLVATAGKASQSFSGFGAKVVELNQGLQLFRAGIELVKKGFDLLIDPTVRQGVEMLNLSRRFGVAVQDFSTFANAAKAFGIPVEGLGFAFRGMAKAIVDAQKPGTEASQIFQKLGIDAKKLGQEIPTKQMEDLATAFARFKITPDLENALRKIFERGFFNVQQLIAILKTDRDEFQKTLDFFQRAGLNFTQQQAEAAESVDIAFTKVRGAFQALIRAFGNTEVLNALADALEAVAEAVINKDLQAAVRTLGLEFANFIKQIATPENVKRFADAIQSLAGSFKLLLAELDRIKENGILSLMFKSPREIGEGFLGHFFGPKFPVTTESLAALAPTAEELRRQQSLTNPFLAQTRLPGGFLSSAAARAGEPGRLPEQTIGHIATPEELNRAKQLTEKMQEIADELKAAQDPAQGLQKEIDKTIFELQKLGASKDQIALVRKEFELIAEARFAQKVQEVLEEIKTRIAETQGEGAHFNAELEKTIATLSKMPGASAAGLQPVIQAFRELEQNTAAQELGKQIDELGTKLRSAGLETQARALADQLTAIGVGGVQSFTQIADAEERLRNPDAKLIADFDKIIETAEAGGNAGEAAFARIVKAQALAVAEFERTKEAYFDVFGAIEKGAGDVFDALVSGTQTMSKAFEAMKTAIVRSFADAFLEGLKKKAGFEDAFRINIVQFLGNLGDTIAGETGPNGLIGGLLEGVFGPKGQQPGGIFGTLLSALGVNLGPSVGNTAGDQLLHDQQNLVAAQGVVVEGQFKAADATFTAAGNLTVSAQALIQAATALASGGGFIPTTMTGGTTGGFVGGGSPSIPNVGTGGGLGLNLGTPSGGNVSLGTGGLGFNFGGLGGVNLGPGGLGANIGPARVSTGFGGGLFNQNIPTGGLTQPLFNRVGQFLGFGSVAASGTLAAGAGVTAPVVGALGGPFFSGFGLPAGGGVLASSELGLSATGQVVPISGAAGGGAGAAGGAAGGLAGIAAIAGAIFATVKAAQALASESAALRKQEFGAPEAGRFTAAGGIALGLGIGGGAALGAAVGTAAFPGIGTVVGAGIGAAIGAAIAQAISSAVAGAISGGISSAVKKGFTQEQLNAKVDAALGGPAGAASLAGGIPGLFEKLFIPSIERIFDKIFLQEIAKLGFPGGAGQLSGGVGVGVPQKVRQGGVTITGREEIQQLRAGGVTDEAHVVARFIAAIIGAGRDNADRIQRFTDVLINNLARLGKTSEEASAILQRMVRTLGGRDLLDTLRLAAGIFPVKKGEFTTAGGRNLEAEIVKAFQHVFGGKAAAEIEPIFLQGNFLNVAGQQRSRKAVTQALPALFSGATPEEGLAAFGKALSDEVTKAFEKGLAKVILKPLLGDILAEVFNDFRRDIRRIRQGKDTDFSKFEKDINKASADLQAILSNPNLQGELKQLIVEQQKFQDAIEAATIQAQAAGGDVAGAAKTILDKLNPFMQRLEDFRALSRQIIFGAAAIFAPAGKQQEVQVAGAEVEAKARQREFAAAQSTQDLDLILNKFQAYATAELDFLNQAIDLARSNADFWRGVVKQVDQMQNTIATIRNPVVGGRQNIESTRAQIEQLLPIALGTKTGAEVGLPTVSQQEAVQEIQGLEQTLLSLAQQNFSPGSAAFVESLDFLSSIDQQIGDVAKALERQNEQAVVDLQNQARDFLSKAGPLITYYTNNAKVDLQREFDKLATALGYDGPIGTILQDIAKAQGLTLPGYGAGGGAGTRNQQPEYVAGRVAQVSGVSGAVAAAAVAGDVKARESVFSGIRGMIQQMLDRYNKPFKDIAALRSVVAYFEPSILSLEGALIDLHAPARLQNLLAKYVGDSRKVQYVTDQYVLTGDLDNLLRALPARRLGGPVIAHTDYLVGEDGPEIARFSQPGMIIPHTMGQMLATTPTPSPTTDTRNVSVTLRLDAGAIAVNGTADPKATAEAVAKALHQKAAPRLVQELQRVT